MRELASTASDDQVAALFAELAPEPLLGTQAFFEHVQNLKAEDAGAQKQAHLADDETLVNSFKTARELGALRCASVD